MSAAVVVAVALAIAGAPNRGLVLPTSTTLSQGSVDVTLEEVGVPEVTLGISDVWEVSVGGAWVPGTDLIGGAATKVKLAQSGPWSTSAFGGIAIDFPELGTRATCPILGGVMGLHRLFDPSLDVDVVALVGVPIVSNNVDAVMIIAPTARYDVNPWLSLMGAVWLRGVVPEDLMGITLDAGARFRFWKMSVDVGWLIDFGVIGPPLPVVSIPGIPMLNASLDF